MLKTTAKVKAGERDHILAAVASLIHMPKVIVCLVLEKPPGDLERSSVHHPHPGSQRQRQPWLRNHRAVGERPSDSQEPRSSHSGCRSTAFRPLPHSSGAVLGPPATSRQKPWPSPGPPGPPHARLRKQRALTMQGDWHPWERLTRPCLPCKLAATPWLTHSPMGKPLPRG